MKKLFFIVLFLFLYMSPKPLFSALPDLYLNQSDISFSNSTPEPGESITITADIHNSGSIYVDSTPFSSHDYQVGTSSHGSAVYNIGWLAQSFVPEGNHYLSEVSLLIKNIGKSTDSLTVEIRKHNLAEEEPSSQVSDIIASDTRVSTFTTTYDWQSFEFNDPPLLLSGVTYWICAESTVLTYTDAYGWWTDSGTLVDMIRVSGTQGASWQEGQGYHIAFYRTYKSTDTYIKCYLGNPSNGGILIGVSTITTPVPESSYKTVSFDWTAVEGSTDIYISIDSPNIITETLESNNTAYKSIIVTPTIPSIIGDLNPKDNSIGIDVNETVNITFNEGMDSTSAKQSISVKAIKDKNGNSIDTAISGTKSYASSILSFNASWQKGYTYKVTVSTQAKDLYNNPITSEISWQFSTILDYSSSNIFYDANSESKVSLEANTLTSDYYLVIDTSPLSDRNLHTRISEATDKKEKKESVFSNLLNNSIRKITLYTGSWPGSEFSGVFTKDANITIPYNINENGKVTVSNGKEVLEKKLKVYYLDESKNLWIKIPNSVVDTSKRTITASINHFSVFAIFGGEDLDLSNAYAYPVPWKPYDENDNTGTSSSGITFINLGSECTIRIYTISGELVKSKNYTFEGGSEEYKWDCTNTEGEAVASGLYIYYIENEKEHKSGKLIIIK